MSRGIKDLRDIICVSRLGGRINDSETDEDVQSICSELDSLPLNRSSDDSSRDICTPQPFSKTQQLPPISEDIKAPNKTSKKKKKKRKQCPHAQSTTNNAVPTSSNHEFSTSTSGCFSKSVTPTKGYASDVSSPDGQLDVDYICQFIDGEAIQECLNKANNIVRQMATWCHTNSNYVEFAHFWLCEFNHQKRIEIVKLEFGILLDYLKLILQSGILHGHIKHADVFHFLRIIFHEYPKRILSLDGLHVFLEYLDILSSEKTNEYRHLLADVHCSTTNSNTCKYILSIRSFSLLSVWWSIITFYNNVHSKSPEQIAEASPQTGDEEDNDGDEDRKDAIKIPPRHKVDERRVIDAIRLGFVDVIGHLINEDKVPITYKDVEEKTLPFIATVYNRSGVLRWLIQKIKTKVRGYGEWLSQPALSGNTILHAAVNSGNVELVKTLITEVHGLDVNVKNELSEGATPLHLALMHDMADIVDILLVAGADQTKTMAGMNGTEIAQCFGSERTQELLKSWNEHNP